MGVIEDINKDRNHLEAEFVACLWKNADLFEEYGGLLKDKKPTLRDRDATFYYRLGLGMFQAGYDRIDAVAVDSYLVGNPKMKEYYEDHGEFQPMADMMSLVSADNAEALYDQIVKKNTLEEMYISYSKAFGKLDQFDGMTSEQVYDYFELINNGISLAVNTDSKVEDLKIDDAQIAVWNSGEAVGLNYGEAAPRLNNITLGLPLGDVCLMAGHSGTGKSSWVFENMVIPISVGTPVCIISNEMKIDAYKLLLLVHILQKDLKYFGLHRKAIKQGSFSEEQMSMIKKAQRIQEEKYTNIKFVKLFDNNTSQIIKCIKRLSAQGVKMFFWDTMKSDDSMDNEMWMQLLMNSRKIFNVVSKENVAMICSFQLALYTSNQRFLDAGCLSNSKQIKEVVSELLMMRKLWDDEMPDGKYDCHPYRLVRDESGPSKWKKEMITLEKDKQYYVVFVDKTRNDEDKKTLLYEWNSRFNKWTELGFCTIVNEHTSYR